MSNHRFKKLSGIAVCLCVLCASAIFFATVTLTPVSDIFSSVIKNNFKSAFELKNKEPFGINLSRVLFRLSFPGIDLTDGLQAKTYDAFADDSPSQEIIANYKNYKYNPYENIPLTDDEPILSIYELYELYGASSGAKIESAANLWDGLEIPPDYYKITPKNYSGQKTKVPQLLTINQTSFNIESSDLQNYLSKPYPVSPFDPGKKDEPIILILDTHATESYVDDGTCFYSPPFTAERTADPDKNVMLIASELRKKLGEYNIPVVQSAKLHDAVSYRDSYTRSLETMNEYLEKYPSIRYIIDVHRDSIIASDGEKFRPAVKINGRDCSQVMLVVGTDDGGAHHPDWRDNLTFAVYLQQKLNDKYPMLARPINLRNARFNQHTTKGSVILEVGSCGSSFSEALYAANLFGECLAELILENN